ncbi:MULTISPECIES: DUF4231 domain-containing protein [unclassified Caballeronia]|uniref:DUF4231 domain-containing protein n=1 Tax=unclassified Caballeronia TaxID=2646786 RepID=UPI0013ECBCCF|nr:MULTISPECIES: DUF4231 domain-containing protein [unclassified Caballeronia]
MALLDETIGKILDTIGATMNALANDPTLHRFYQQEKPVLRVISPLATGADRVVARQALARQWLLSAPLPFPQQEYEKDFTDSVDEFRSLLARAKAINEVVELDGRRDAEGAAYFEAGHFVLRHSDLIIAVWDGLEAAGEGGTGEIVETALRLGLPVVHIDSAAPHAVKLLLDPPLGEGDRSFTTEELVRLIVIPAWKVGSTAPTSTRHHHKAVATYLWDEPESVCADGPDLSWSGLKVTPLIWLGTVFPLLQRCLADASPATTPELNQPASAGSLAAQTYIAHFQRSDALATHYANIHRSAFVMIYLLGSISLVAAFTAQFLAGVPLGKLQLNVCATYIELAALGFVLVLVLAELRFRWRERWLDYRTLAEQFRQTDLLATIGGSEPCGCMNLNSEIHPTRGWVPWFVAAVKRSVGIVGARYDAAYLSEIRDWAVKQRLRDQLAYNEATAHRNAKISKCLRLVSVGLFALTILAAGAELCWPKTDDSGWLRWLAGVFPALGAASFGIRNQAEFEIVVHRSTRLIGLLAMEKANIERLSGDRLTSKSLRLAMQRSAQIMQDDSRAWAEIFEVKESEVV